MSQNPSHLPEGLPVPMDDGACLHLRGMGMPDLALPSTAGDVVRLDQLGGAEPSTGAVLFFYPRTGIPGQPPHQGFSGEDWDSIPGARGCTPQSCGFRDLYSEFQRLGVEVFGLSTNTTGHQLEFKTRNHVPFEFLSDSDLKLVRAMDLPTFEFPVESGGPNTLIKRMAWYIRPAADGPRIAKVWHPVFPPNENAAKVLAWLQRRARIIVRPSNSSDASFIREELTHHWGSTQIWSLGRAYQAESLDGFIAEIDGERIGQLTYAVQPGGYQCEVITLSTQREGLGVGSQLLEAAIDAARLAECIRIYLTTTNDNTRAIGFYQREGWRLAALHKGNVDEARKRVPQIPRVGPSGIAVRDEVELELWLRDA